MLDAAVASAPGLFAQVARRFDLSIVGQPEPDTAGLDRLIVEAALFDLGRPVLVVPYIQRAGLRLDHVMLCWDGSRSAARAAGDAMPFFRRSKLVEVVIVGSEVAKSDEIRGADIASHLARHGAKVELKRINTTETDVAGIILSQAADMLDRFHDHGRLRSFAAAGVHPGGCDARNPRFHDGSGADVALNVPSAVFRLTGISLGTSSEFSSNPDRAIEAACVMAGGE